MSTLVAPLAAGIAAAPSGTARFYAYGTGYQTPALAFDVDGNAIGTSVTLDAYGAYECYVIERVQVRVETSAGVAVRTFALQCDEASSTVESASFTGTNQETGAQEAGGLIVQGSVLDQVLTSFGAKDWKVRPTGSASDLYLKDALVTATDNFFNVQSATYGAVGDGSTDDILAIQAAIAAADAADGGIVYFPAGTYKVTTSISLTSQKIKLLGAGHRASIIVNHSTSANAITISSGSSDDCGIVIEDLAITANTTSTGVAVHASAATGLQLRNVRLEDHLVGVKADTRVHIDGGTIDTVTSGVAYCVQVASGGTGDGTTIRGAELIMSATNANGTAVLVQRADVSVENCIIDVSAGAATSACIRVNHASGVNVNVRGNRFVAGSGNFGLYVSVNVSFNELGGNRASSGTLFGRTGGLTTASGQLRLSRYGSSNTHSQAGGSYLLDAQYGTHFLTSTAGDITIVVNTSSLLDTHGSRMTVAIRMSGSGGIPTFSTGFAPASAVGTIDDTKMAIFEFVYYQPTDKWQVVSATADTLSPHVP